jgi:hypothetical protein
MPSREGENAGGSVPQEGADLKADIDVDCRFQDEPDDNVVRNLNKMGRMKLCRFELIDKLKEEHRDFIAICIRFDEQFRKDQEDRNAAAAAAQSPSYAAQQ